MDRRTLADRLAGFIKRLFFDTEYGFVRWWVFPSLTVLLPLVVVAVVLHLQPPPLEPKYLPGQHVRAVIGGHKGQVVRAGCNEYACYYDVRFNGTQLRTNTRVLREDDPAHTEPLALVRGMRDFELEAQ